MSRQHTGRPNHLHGTSTRMVAAGNELRRMVVALALHRRFLTA
jgi:hypothetical protein